MYISCKNIRKQTLKENSTLKCYIFIKILDLPKNTVFFLFFGGVSPIQTYAADFLVEHVDPLKFITDYLITR